jgi:hypothetical protein
MNVVKNQNVAFPLAKKASHVPDDTVDIILSLENKKLVQGSVAINAHIRVTNAGTALTSAEQVQIDSDAGYHSIFRDITVEFRQIGITENFSYYPRYVKMKTQATKFRGSLGTESYNCVEGKTPTKVIRGGMDKGQASVYLNGADVAGAVPFTIKPDVSVNKSNVPIPGNQVGTVRIRTRLAPANEVLFGTDNTSAFTYEIIGLRVHYETIPDDNTRPPLQLEVYNVNRQVIETNNANLSTFVPGLADSVHISFHKVSIENTTTENYLRCLPIPGKPLLGSVVDPNNGAERVYYAVNDTDTALVGFTMETRPEMMWNYLRSFINEPRQFAVTDDRIDAPKADCYGLGINFGTMLDFSQQKFACEIDSEIDEPFSAYLYFRGMITI